LDEFNNRKNIRILTYTEFEKTDSIWSIDVKYIFCGDGFGASE